MGIEWKTTAVEAKVGDVRLTVRQGGYATPAPDWQWRVDANWPEIGCDGRADSLEAAQHAAVVACEAEARKLSAHQTTAAKAAQDVADAIVRARETK